VTKKRVNSKAKGNRWELELSKILSDAFGGEFRRVPQSGGFMGGFNRSRNENIRADAKEILSGDLIAPQGFFFVVEAKHHKDEPKFHQILAGESKKLDEWIRQSEEEAKASMKEPMIVFKVDRQGAFAVLNNNVTCVDYKDRPHLHYKGKVVITLEDFCSLGDKAVINPVEWEKENESKQTYNECEEGGTR
jgi:hypothetical protein